jgi:hypothetical protein
MKSYPLIEDMNFDCMNSSGRIHSSKKRIQVVGFAFYCALEEVFNVIVLKIGISYDQLYWSCICAADPI